MTDLVSVTKKTSYKLHDDFYLSIGHLYQGLDFKTDFNSKQHQTLYSFLKNRVLVIKMLWAGLPSAETIRMIVYKTVKCK